MTRAHEPFECRREDEARVLHICAGCYQRLNPDMRELLRLRNQVAAYLADPLRDNDVLDAMRRRYEDLRDCLKILYREYR